MATYDVSAEGGVADAKIVTDAAMTTGSATLTSASASFVTGDVGKTIVVAGASAGGAALVTTISSRTSSTTIVLATAASTTVSGVDAVWGTNNETAYASARAKAATRGGTVYFPAGAWLVQRMTLGNYIKHAGAGKSTTQIFPCRYSTGDFITMDTGVVQHAHVSDMEIRAIGQGDTSALRCFHLQATAVGGQGGLWFTNFQNLEISRFSGETFWFEGGGNTYDAPHQFNAFKNVAVDNATNRSNTPVLRFTGQCGQFTFDESCVFNGATPGNNSVGTAILRFERKGAADNTRPYAFTFVTTSVQDCPIGVDVQYGQSIRFLGCYFENVATAVKAANAATVSVRDSYFNGGVTWGVQGSTEAYLSGGGNHFWNGITTMYGAPSGDTGYFDFVGDHFEGVSPATSRMTTQVTAAATFNIGGARSVVVNPSATPITTITSSALPGERISLKANAGEFILSTGGNVHLAGFSAPLSIPQDHIVTLVRHDLGDTWFVASISGPAHKAEQLHLLSGTSVTPEANVETWRVSATGNLTVNNPTMGNGAAIRDGGRYVLDVKNSSAGVITVTLGSIFLGTFTPPASGKRRTQLYVYDSAAAKFVPVGAQSGDL